MTDLLFQVAARTGQADLIFGLTADGLVPIAPVSVAAAGKLSGLRGAATVKVCTVATAGGKLSGLRGAAVSVYDNRVTRHRTVVKVAAHQSAVASTRWATGYWGLSNHLRGGKQAYWQPAINAQKALQPAYQTASPLPIVRAQQWQYAVTTSVGRSALHQTTAKTHVVRATRQQLGAAATHTYTVPYQTGVSLRQPRSNGWQAGIRLITTRAGSSGVGTGRLGRQFDTAYWQSAARPTTGRSTAPVLVIVSNDPCYLPSTGLVFDEVALASGALLFYCERRPVATQPTAQTVVIPVKKVYMVFNSATLRRIDGNITIPVFDMTLAIDASAWTWTINASLPASELSNIEPSVFGEPVEIEVVVNGVAYRALLENISRDRSFGKAGISIGCRGRSALLDAPYSPVQSFGNTVARTAQQLMADVLTLNGQSIGWSVDWQTVDWLVPAGTFVHQGSRMSALNAIVGAVGAYIQPHATDKILRVLPKYPEAPWNWASAITPDYQLPSAVTTRENITWREKARYNRVFVSGISTGVLGQVTRSGTAGDLVAPMVTDALITQAVAARQRGLSVLSDTGRVAEITLSLPVLSDTGIITPGKFVDFVDLGVTRRGIVRSVQVTAGLPEIYQTINVETHINA